MDQRAKGTIIESGDFKIDSARVACINKILQFDNSIDFEKFDFVMSGGSRPRKLIKLLISLDSLPHTYKQDI
jgi:hypothetical protein